ncbi:MAG: RNA polymerase factor sigma-54 [Armatimonadetes bacterium]|nr:RNA polymerase factor sigma-54 [Armatimonadota bacterium]
MRLDLVQESRLEQTLSPRMIQFYELLQCPLQELDQLVAAELASNPALELAESGPTELESAAAGLADLPLPSLDPSADDWDEGDDPLAALPAPMTLQDHLRWHFTARAHTPEERRIGLLMIEEIDGDGYFCGGIGEVAMLLGANVVEVERVLGLVQHLDPPGVGARDLRECLQIQLAAAHEQGRPHVVAERLVEECFEPFSRNLHSLCARKLRVSEAAVADAAEFIRAQCQPYPGRQFRVPWQDTDVAPPARPEVALLDSLSPPPQYVAEVIESRRLGLRVDRIYQRLFQELSHAAPGDPVEAEHVRVCVRLARQFITSLNQRRETVRRIAEEVANEQAEFIAHGPTALKPLTRLEIARRLGVHESTVGRAVAGKHVLLPSHEVVAFEVFFDGAQPVRIALGELIAREDPTRPLSDQRLAALLAEQGHDLARRTVAKYREGLRIPPASQRRRR